MTTGRALDSNSLGSGWTAVDIAKLASALATLAVLLALRRWVKSPFAMPAALLAMWVTGALALRGFGIAGAEQGWYFRSLGSLTGWWPFSAASSTQTSLWPLLAHVPDLLAVTIVALVSLVAKVSSIEVARQTSGDLDREFRAHGIAESRCDAVWRHRQQHADRKQSCPGAGRRHNARRWTHRCADPRLCRAREFRSARLDPGSDFWRPGLLPWIHILHGRPGRPYAQRAWLDLVLAIGIMIICARYGYLVGVAGWN